MVEHGNKGGEGKRSFRVIKGEGKRSGIDNIPQSPLRDITNSEITIHAEPGIDTTIVVDNADQIVESIRRGEQTMEPGDRMVTLEDALRDELGGRRARKSGRGSLND